MTSGVRIGIDTGGTFTDCVLEVEGGAPLVLKVPSTPDDPGRAILEGIGKICAQAEVSDQDVSWLAHGTTVATNAILQERWSKVGLITNRGFRDVLEIGTQMRPSLYSLHSEKPVPLVPRDRRLEISGRTGADASEVEPVDRDEIRRVVEQLVEAGVEAIAVSLLFSFLDPSHEHVVREIANEVSPETYVCISSDLSSEFREYPRTSTTVINAALAPVVREYIERLGSELDARGLLDQLHIMQSNGGVMNAVEAADASHRLILSGPAAGIIGAAEACRSADISDALTFDMGGTSTDVGIILGKEGRLRFGTLLNDSYPVQVPMLDLHTVGAGGGSIAWIDKGNALKVGPQSAGAVPGPACYGLGGEEPTVTDAYLALGRIDSDSALGSIAGLDPELARKSLLRIAEPLGLEVEQAAMGILDVATATMAGALRVVSSKRGYDPRDFALVAFGGAGPVHSAALAKDLGMSQTLIPQYPGALSAVGLLTCNIEHSLSRAFIAEFEQVDAGEFEAALAELVEEGRSKLRESGVEEEKQAVDLYLDIRYQGQEYSLTVATSEGSDRLKSAADAFHQLHDDTYGHSAPGEPLELVNLRARAIGHTDSTKGGAGPVGTDPKSSERDVYFANEGWIPTPVVVRSSIESRAEIEGPVVIEQHDTTIVVEPGQLVRGLDDGSLLIETNGVEDAAN